MIQSSWDTSFVIRRLFFVKYKILKYVFSNININWIKFAARIFLIYMLALESKKHWINAGNIGK